MAAGSMVEFVEGTGRDPFLIFPEEVWVMILDKVEDSRDAWNLIKAFLELDLNVALQKRKRFWFFGLVIPHLIPWRNASWVEEQDLLNCRQVCKKWSSAVDGFLEGQPQLQAYHPETQGQLPGPGRFHWNVKAYLNPWCEEDSLHFGGTGFKITDYYNPQAPGVPPVQRFLREMEAHPPGRSPFLSRALSICNEDEGDDSYWAKETTDFMEDVLALHRKFGEHVWFYKVNFHWDSLGASCMIENIAHLPNLKMLHVVVEVEMLGVPPPTDDSVNKFVEQLGKDLPALPFLETLRLENCPGQLSHFLISRFAAQIRRLDLDMNMGRDEYSRLFPNLSEFDITDYRMRPDGDQMKKLLFSLEAPQLSKLQVKFPSVDQCHQRTFTFVIEDDVFQWLGRFPNLKFLALGYDCRFVHFIENGTLDPVKDSISSLQYLAIQTSFEMNYNFLRCLPSLQHLQIFVSSKPVVIDLSSSPVVRILEEIQTGSMYKSNIWELLPKLKTVALLVEDAEGIRIAASYHFNREGYEFERGLNNGRAVDMGGDEDAPAPLRKDIIKFLQEEFDMGQPFLQETDDEDENDEESDLDGDSVLCGYNSYAEEEDDVEDEDDNEDI